MEDQQDAQGGNRTRTPIGTRISASYVYRYITWAKDEIRAEGLEPPLTAHRAVILPLDDARTGRTTPRRGESNSAPGGHAGLFAGNDEVFLENQERVHVAGSAPATSRSRPERAAAAPHVEITIRSSIWMAGLEPAFSRIQTERPAIWATSRQPTALWRPPRDSNPARRLCRPVRSQSRWPISAKESTWPVPPRRPLGPHPSALLLRHTWKSVWMAGFEPAFSRIRTERPTRLGHIQKKNNIGAR